MTAPLSTEQPGPAPAHAERCLKPAGARSVWLVRRPGEGPRTVKSWPLDPALAAKWLLRSTQPQRHARWARRLAARGIPTPRVVAGPRPGRRGQAPVIELELEHVPGRTALEVLASGDAAAIERGAAAVAALLAALLRQRLFNRDLKLSNVLIDAEGRAWLLDPVALRPLAAPRRQAARMLERLAVEPRERGMAIPASARRAVIHATLAAAPARRPG